MRKTSKTFRSAVRRYNAENYLLASLITFAVTVIFTRAFLQLTGFPQIGNSVLHIAHALWGGLFLFIAVLLPLAYANRWALKASAILSGIGIGLFIDEVGKFITQSNDYFFPPALPLIYAFFLLSVLVFLRFRRSPSDDSRHAIYHAIEGLHDVFDGNLDSQEAARISAQLAIAAQSEQPEIASLANTLMDYLRGEELRWEAAAPGAWTRLAKRFEAFGKRLGRRTHRIIISITLIVWTFFVLGYIAIIFQGGPNLNSQVLEWKAALIGIQGVIGILMIAASITWFSRKESRGSEIATYAFLLSLIALQLPYFYISQFSAISFLLLQYICLQLLFTYRRSYLQ